MKAKVLTGLLAVSVLAACSNTDGSKTAQTAPSVQPPASAAPSPSATPKTYEKVTVGDFTQEKVITKEYIVPSTYKKFFAASEAGPLVPGLQQGIIPQGMTYLKEKNWLIISYYRDDKQPSLVSVTDLNTGKLIKTLKLYSTDSTPYTGHAGGVTVSGKHLWVGSDSKVYQIDLADLEKAQDGGKLVFKNIFPTEAKASYVVYADGILWVGEYADGTDYPTSETHYLKNSENKTNKAWAAGYKLDSATDSIAQTQQKGSDGKLIPDVILSTPDKIQGMELFQGEFVLSQSGGRSNDSLLITYPNPLKDKPFTEVTIGSVQVPVHMFDGKNKKEAIIVPPMTEGIVARDKQLGILFESGAEKYRNGSFPLDEVYWFSKQ
ncbi:hypothetical protein J31TS4_09640 [Paenibacillus sp. J31TS4]|uniref:hypothetical protein n=1 Tax=Paenibacillus sp. J31TS4 TaxID=2807195 RepID=UPI001B2D319B|nr:hypothetical protein [Paenibacillus sp. J31TS4]GIP37684.1 hypothetical protein J31TS4_09640 [Paenibacillus sp. J31TS4]